MLAGTAERGAGRGLRLGEDTAIQSGALGETHAVGGASYGSERNSTMKADNKGGKFTAHELN